MRRQKNADIGDGRDDLRGREEVGEGEECMVRRVSNAKRGMAEVRVREEGILN